MYIPNFSFRKLLVSLIVTLLSLPFIGESQVALTNAGGAIKVFGDAVPSTQLTLVVLGDFENQTDGVNDGTIDIADNGHMYVTGNWTNNSFSNVFLNTSTSLVDGIVTLENNNTNQVIAGITATFFENLRINGSRKILMNDLNSVNNILLIDAPLILNTRTFEIKNQDPSGITYKSGFIKSETLPGNHGYIKWNTGNYVGTFVVPFGSDGISSTNDLNLSLTTNGPMAMADYFTFATYPTDMFNQPLPMTASPLEFEVRKVVDRFWLIEPNNRINLAPLDIAFSYVSEDVSSTKNSINPDQLVAARNNTNLAKWLDMDPRGSHYLNTVEISNVTPSEFYPIWTLVNMPPPITELFAPDAFSPDGDGLNDLFIPIFQVDFEIIDYELIIYDRWGSMVFKTTDKNQGWNGIKMGKNAEPTLDVYTWVIIVKGRNYGDTQAEGKKKKFVGRVTIVL